MKSVIMLQDHRQGAGLGRVAQDARNPVSSAARVRLRCPSRRPPHDDL